jgi:hypothetical protein
MKDAHVCKICLHCSGEFLHLSDVLRNDCTLQTKQLSETGIEKLSPFFAKLFLKILAIGLAQANNKLLIGCR